MLTIDPRAFYGYTVVAERHLDGLDQVAVLHRETLFVSPTTRRRLKAATTYQLEVILKTLRLVDITPFDVPRLPHFKTYSDCE